MKIVISVDTWPGYLAAALFFLEVTLLLTLVVHVVLYAGRTAWRRAVAVVGGQTGARSTAVDLSAAGDHVGVRRAGRRRRVAIRPRGLADDVAIVFAAVAQSCRRYYRD